MSPIRAFGGQNKPERIPYGTKLVVRKDDGNGYDLISYDTYEEMRNVEYKRIMGHAAVSAVENFSEEGEKL